MSGTGPSGPGPLHSLSHRIPKQYVKKMAKNGEILTIWDKLDEMADHRGLRC